PPDEPKLTTQPVWLTWSVAFSAVGKVTVKPAYTSVPGGPAGVVTPVAVKGAPFSDTLPLLTRPVAVVSKEICRLGTGPVPVKDPPRVIFVGMVVTPVGVVKAGKVAGAVGLAGTAVPAVKFGKMVALVLGLPEFSVAE